VVGYDGAMKDEEQPVGRKPKPGWKPWKPPPEKRVRWERWGLHGKTVWDWLGLLVVPVMLAIVVGVFTTLQIFFQVSLEDTRQQAIANQSAEFQKVIEEFRAQEASLQAYLDLMTTLLLEHDLRESAKGSEVRAIARAQTLATITQLDGKQNQIVTRFLSDSGLLREPPLLAKADLEGAKLHKAVLQEANLAGTNLAGADLAEAVLFYADFSDVQKVGEDTIHITANLTKADLSKAALQEADLAECTLDKATLTNAKLQGADLSSASLQDANLTKAALLKADLSSTASTPNLKDMPLWFFKERSTNLTDANLSHAALLKADLSRAYLSGADLTDADLTDADLTDAKGWTTEQLTAAGSLKGATMPNGQKYEEWLKNKEG
jgi:uncharacterized protein YjbI with pentapeptide repeats